MDNVRDKMELFGRRVRFELCKDKRKTTVAAGLALLLMFLGLRVLVSGPDESLADDSSEARTVPDITAIRDTSDADVRTAADSRKLEYIRGIDRDFRRDIFEPKLGAFRQKDEASGTETSVEADDTQDVEEAGRQRIAAEAQSLRLQSTAVSGTSTAIINGKVLLEGETINGFRVVEIKPHACLIEKEGVRMRLRMSR